MHFFSPVDFFFLLFCGAVALGDLLFRRVFNWLLVVGIAGNVLVLATAGHEASVFAQQWSTAFLGFFAGLALFLPFYVFRVMGAGDVKFFAVLGFWLGLPGLVPVWLGGSVLAGIHALAAYCVRSGLTGEWVMLQLAPVQGAVSRIPVLRRAGQWVSALRAGRRGIPYAAYLAVAAVVVVLGR
ncbi:prepilin peptidase [uncultured Pigmentiphaga sp.]|uniref:A24 family peptidase n=1 Tax=uncultured Pigmentiphaga sp. TaxID=340361 RepID=UPI00260A443A|nr:prepilin peptidase [uncultured Pigmentiphaga sp.]